MQPRFPYPPPGYQGQQQQSSSVSAAPTMYHQGMATPGIPPPSPSPFIPPPLPQPYPHLPQQFPHNAGMMSHPPHPVPSSPYPHNNPMLFMMPHQAQHQTLHPPPHPHLMQQHPGLLPPHMMHHPLHFPRPPMQPQMMAPPPNIRAPPPAGWTPALTTVSSSQNPVAVVPLTVYIGRIPPELDDEMIKKVFGVFGKILRWNRPMDSSQTIKPFGFVTFEHAQCALRCCNILGSIPLPSEDNKQDTEAEDKEEQNLRYLAVKIGTKETAVLDSLTKWETAQGRAATVQDTEAQMREKVISILNRSDVAEEEKAAAIAREGAAKAAELAATSAVSASSMPSLTSEEEQELDEETLKERQVMAEIEKFRARQALRDKEAEELKRERVKERLKTLRENQARMAAVAIEETAKAEAQLQFEVGEKRKADEAAALAVNHGQDHQSRLRRNEGVDEEELKRRRKEQVAALVSSEALEEDFSRRTMKVGLKLTVPSKANVKMAVPASSMWSANAEEEAKPLRLMVPINYGDLEPSEKEGGVESEEAKRKKKQLELVDQIPTDKNILFAYKIDWSTVQSLQLAETSLRPWIVKKMVEYLGQEEKTLVDFIVAKIHNRCAPTELLKELDAVLDEDAEQFVVKLWRMLIFSIIASVNN